MVAESRPRRGHGEDSIYYDNASHYWVGAVSLGCKGGKRVRRKVTGRAKTEVRDKLRELRRDLEIGVRPSASRTVNNTLDDWLAHGLNGRSDRARELYRESVQSLHAWLGEGKLRELGDRLIAGELRQEHGLVFASAVGTPLDHHNVLRQFRRITEAAGLGTDWVPKEMPFSLLRQT